MSTNSGDHRLAEDLTLLEPGKLSLEVFSQIARLTVTPVVEIVPFFTDNLGTKVHLQKRDSNDPLWANLYHVPGGMIRPDDPPGTLDGVLSRISDSKLEHYRPSDPTFVEARLCRVVRGVELALIYYANLSCAPHEDTLFDPHNLPVNMIESHDNFVEASYRKFVENDDVKNF